MICSASLKGLHTRNVALSRLRHIQWLTSAADQLVAIEALSAVLGASGTEAPGFAVGNTPGVGNLLVAELDV